MCEDSFRVMVFFFTHTCRKKTQTLNNGNAGHRGTETVHLNPASNLSRVAGAYLGPRHAHRDVPIAAARRAGRPPPAPRGVVQRHGPVALQGGVGWGGQAPGPGPAPGGPHRGPRVGAAERLHHEGPPARHPRDRRPPGGEASGATPRAGGTLRRPNTSIGSREGHLLFCESHPPNKHFAAQESCTGVPPLLPRGPILATVPQGRLDAVDTVAGVQQRGDRQAVRRADVAVHRRWEERGRETGGAGRPGALSWVGEPGVGDPEPGGGGRPQNWFA